MKKRRENKSKWNKIKQKENKKWAGKRAKKETQIKWKEDAISNHWNIIKINSDQIKSN